MTVSSFEVSRFEVRSCRTGHLEGACATFDKARAYIDGYHAEVGHDDHFCIVDTYLPVTGDDDRIVWREGDVSPRASAWLKRIERTSETVRP